MNNKPEDLGNKVEDMFDRMGDKTEGVFRRIQDLYDTRRSREFFRSPLLWGYNFLGWWLSIGAIHLGFGIVGTILLFLGKTINFNLGFGLYVIAIGAVLLAYKNEGETHSLYNNYGVIDLSEEKRLKKKVLLTLLLSLLPGLAILIIFYQSVLNPIQYDSLWLGLSAFFLLFAFKLFIKDTYYNEVEELYDRKIIGKLTGGFIAKLKKSIISVLGRPGRKFSRAFDVVFTVVLLVTVFPLIISGFTYFMIFFVSWFIRYDYKGLWIIQKIEYFFQYLLNEFLQFLGLPLNELVVYINLVLLLIGLFFFLLHFLVFLSAGEMHKIKLLYQRYTPELEAGTIDYSVLPFKEGGNINNRGTTSGGMYSAVDQEIRIETIAARLVRSGKLSDQEICTIVAISMPRLQLIKDELEEEEDGVE